MTDDTSGGEQLAHGAAWLLPEAENNPTGKRGMIYELFILGELMGGPHHGYKLREILSRILGPFQQISWGALYPLIRRLEQAGLIEPLVAPEPAVGSNRGRGRQRIAYRITDSGRERFFTLLLEPGAYSADYPDLLIVKLNYFGHITLDQQRALLAHYRSYLQFEEDYLRAGLQRIESTASIPDNERAHIYRVVRYRLNGVQPRLVWIDDEVARLEREAGQ